MKICTKNNCRSRNRTQPESAFVDDAGHVFKTCADCRERAKKYRAGQKSGEIEPTETSDTANRYFAGLVIRREGASKWLKATR